MNRVLALVLFASGAFALRISPETPTDFAIQLCSTQRRQKTHGHMQFFPTPVKFCASIRSSKHRRNLLNDLRGTTSHDAKVTVRWRQLTDNRYCTVEFMGYQRDYRLTPDFGAYEDCQFSLSRHVYALSEALSYSGMESAPLRFNSTNNQCPIIGLPTTYTDYVSCSLLRYEWYVLEWQSAIRYETFQNGSYGNYWANHSTAYVFQPTDELARNGTEKNWLSRLILLDARSNGCDRASVLVRLEPNWPLSTSISVTYKVVHSRKRISTQMIYSGPIHSWVDFDFDLRQHVGRHEVCVHMSAKGLPSIGEKVCRVLVDELDCPFPEKLLSFSGISTCLCSLVLFLSSYVFL